jgi:phage head maturation protease
VIEVSAVNFPAYGGTNIDSRSLDSDRRALDNARASLDKDEIQNKVEKPKPDYRAKTLITMYKGR